MIGIRATLILMSGLLVFGLSPALPAAAETAPPPKPSVPTPATAEQAPDTFPEPTPRPAPAVASEDDSAEVSGTAPAADGEDVPAEAAEDAGAAAAPAETAATPTEPAATPTEPAAAPTEPAATPTEPAAAPAPVMTSPLVDPPLPVPRPITHLFEDGPFHVFVRIFKQESALELWYSRGGEFKLARTYPICAWSGSLGPKLREGDFQSPEGFYVVDRSQLKPNSDYHRAFNVGYPNAFDKAHDRTGSFLMVHGACASVGCYAMTDPAIEEIYGIVEKALIDGQPGIPVHIFPFRMTEKAFREHPGSQWIGFWRNLKQGYDIFEKTRIPPQASACGKRYGFGEPKSWCKPITGWQTARRAAKKPKFTGTIQRSNDR